MSLKDSIKPISYLKANAAKVIKDVSENGKTLYITQNGEAKLSFRIYVNMRKHRILWRYLKYWLL